MADETLNEVKNAMGINYFYDDSDLCGIIVEIYFTFFNVENINCSQAASLSSGA